MKVIILIFVVFMVFSVDSFADSKEENSNFLTETVNTLKEECKEKKGADYLNCWAEVTPQKCKSLVYSNNRTAWKRCVWSCGSESLYSRTFGECSN